MPEKTASTLRGITLTLALAAPGCAYVIPFAVPPAHLHVATGAAEGVITAPGPELGDGPSTGPVKRSGDLYAEVRGSVALQQGMGSRRRREFEVNAGYGAMFFLPRYRTLYAHHGPYVELGFAPTQIWSDRNTLFRTYLSLAPQLVFVDVGRGTAVGAAARASVTAEVVSFARAGGGEHTRTGAFWGAIWGEYAVSIELSTGVEYVERSAFWTIGLGVSVRLPSFAYVGAGVTYPGAPDGPSRSGHAPETAPESEPEPATESAAPSGLGGLGGLGEPVAPVAPSGDAGVAP